MSSVEYPSLFLVARLTRGHVGGELDMPQLVVVSILVRIQWQPVDVFPMTRLVVSRQANPAFSKRACHPAYSFDYI